METIIQSLVNVASRFLCVLTILFFLDSFLFLLFLFRFLDHKENIDRLIEKEKTQNLKWFQNDAKIVFLISV